VNASDLMFRVVALAALAALVSAWGLPAPSGPFRSVDLPTLAAQTVVIETGASQVRARVSEPITLSFDYPGATGNRWRPRLPLPRNLQLSGEETTALKPGLPGGPARQQITLVASAPGDFQIDFVFRRSWEPETPDDRRVTVHFVITP
jgi:predicted secreted protein